MIHNLSSDELLDDMNMPIMDGVECAAVKPYAQGVLLIEAENDIQKECKDSECNETECIWWYWKFAGCFFSEIHHE
jgi:hypothetical protein